MMKIMFHTFFQRDFAVEVESTLACNFSECSSGYFRCAHRNLHF